MRYADLYWILVVIEANSCSLACAASRVWAGRAYPFCYDGRSSSATGREVIICVDTRDGVLDV